MDWKPIDEAPKDGTHILLFADFGDAKECVVGYYGPRDSVGEKPFGEFVWRQSEGSTLAEKIVTHWAPLPPPPHV